MSARRARLVIVAFCFVAACDRGSPPAPPSAAPAPPPAVPVATPPRPEPSKAALRSLADAFIRDWIADARHAAYLKLDRSTRASKTEAQIGEVMDGLSRNFGKLLEAEYDSTETGANLSFAGLRKYWSFLYNVRTATAPKGKYQAEVTLAADPDPAVIGFSFAVTIASGHHAK